MTPITVPAPTLAFDDAAPGVAMLEKPIELRSAPVTLADGTALGPDRVAAGYFVYRRSGPSAAAEIWDESAGVWKNTATANASALQPAPFAFLPDEPLPWFNLVVAAGQKDAGSADRFARAVAGYPRYFFRNHFTPREGTDATATLSAPTAEVQFVGVADTVRAGIAAGPGQSLENATELHLFLRGAGLQPVGAVSIYNESGQARIEVAKWDGAASPVARISLRADGTIMLNDTLQIEAAGGNATLRCSGTLTLDAPVVRATNFVPI
jgi:hypothetical protein